MDDMFTLFMKIQEYRSATNSYGEWKVKCSSHNVVTTKSVFRAAQMFYRLSSLCALDVALNISCYGSY